MQISVQLDDDYTKRKSRGKADYCLAGVEQGTFRDSAPAYAGLDGWYGSNYAPSRKSSEISHSGWVIIYLELSYPALIFTLSASVLPPPERFARYFGRYEIDINDCPFLPVCHIAAAFFWHGLVAWTDNFTVREAS